MSANNTGPEQILLDGLEGIRAYARTIGEGTVGYLVDEAIVKFTKEKERLANRPPY